MAGRWSAALLAFHEGPDGVAVFLAHMGGPFWARRDDGGWSVPKGEFDPEAEDPARAARREFAEEIGVAAPDGVMLDLGTHPQPSGKRIRAFAVRADPTLQFVASNTFPLQWPPGSGRVEHFPEVDRAQWFGADAARRKLVPGQVTILEALQRALGGRGPGQGP